MEQISSLLHPHLNPRLDYRYCAEKKTFALRSLRAPFILRIGNRDCLTFFDSRANAHLMNGQLAIQEKLQLMSSKPKALEVIGGGSIMTEYGNFRFNLGPGENKKFHKITAVGLRKITAIYPELTQ